MVEMRISIDNENYIRFRDCVSRRLIYEVNSFFVPNKEDVVVIDENEYKIEYICFNYIKEHDLPAQEYIDIFVTKRNYK